MKSPVSFFAGRPRLAVALGAVFALAGACGILGAKVRLYPTVAEPTVSISCTYPGANSREVMNTVAGPIEDQINGVEDMLYMTSSCADSGAYSCTVAFEIGTDRDVALMKVQTLVQQAMSFLPQEVKNAGLTVKAGTPEDFAILTLRSPGRQLTFQEITDYVFGVVQPAVTRVQGVGDATVRSDKVAMRVWFDPKRMAALGVNSEEAVSAIRGQNIQASIGSVGATPTGEADGRVVSLIARGRLKSVEDFEEIIVRTGDEGGMVRLRDIARVELGQQAYSYVSSHGEVPAVQILISLFPGEDLRRTRAQLVKTLSELERDFPRDLVWELSYDATDFLYASFAEFARAAGIGLLAFFVLVGVFLRDVRRALFLPLAACLAVLPAFAVVAACGESLNVLTLFAAFLACALASLGVLSVLCGASPVTTGVGSLVVLALFVPVGCIQGLTGAVYRQFALVMGSAAVCTALVALVIAPAVCARFPARPMRETSGGWLARLAGWFAGSPFVTAAAVLFLVVAALALTRRVPSTLVPDEDTGRINLNVETPECTRMPLTEAAVREASRMAASLDGVAGVLTLCGNSGTGGSGENQALVTVLLDDWRKRRGEGLDDRAIARRLAGLNATQPLASFYPLPPATLPGLGGSVQLFVMSTGDSDPIRLANEAHRIERLIGELPLVERAVCGYTATTPHLRVNVDRAKCELVGVPLSTLYATLQTYLGSLYVNDINLGTQVNRVTVEADWSARDGQEAVKDLFVRSSSGEMVPVDSLVSFEEEIGPRVCYRYNKYVYCAITVVPADGVSSREVIDACIRLLDKDLPSGFAYAWGNLTFHEMRGVGNTGLMALVAALFAYLILVGRFNSWRRPLAAMLPAVGVAFGALAALDALDVPLTVHAQMAILVLAALAVVGAVLIQESDDPNRMSRLVFAFGLSFAVCAAMLLLSSGAGCKAIRSVGAAAAGGALGLALAVPLLVRGRGPLTDLGVI